MNKEKNRKILIWLFVIYCFALAYVLFFPNSHRGPGNSFRLFNIVPFKTFVDYSTRLKEDAINTDIVIRNIFVNLILFLPMGVALPILFEKINSFWKFLLIIILLIVLVEIIQLLTLTGSADIDDVILNSIGGCVGYGIARLGFVKNLFCCDGVKE